MYSLIYLSLKDEVPPDSYWDQHLLGDLLKHFNVYPKITDQKEAVVVIPGAYQGDVIEKINKELAKLDECVVIVTSDEENKFPLEKLRHKNMRLFATYPHDTPAAVTWLPIGYPVDLEVLPVPHKSIDVYFYGQVNHEDRVNMYKSLSELPDTTKTLAHATGGFAQGLIQSDYERHAAEAKVMPAPRGNISPDSFRLYEALENGAVPIAQNRGFWDKLFGSYPFPVVDNKEQWPGYIADALAQYPALNNRCQAWWMRKKQEIKRLLIGSKEQMTVIIPVSPILSHPSIDILKETIERIRLHTNDQIILTFDGVRKEQEHMRIDYEEHIRRVLWHLREEENVTPYIFEEHLHQVGMLRKIIDSIETPCILYVEQDTPLTEDTILWQDIFTAIESGESNLIRLHFEAFIPKEHTHLMIGEPENNLLKTVQWSQRPHVASTAFYKRILETCFSPDANCFVEDLMHGKVADDWNKYGEQGWNQWRLHIYHPEGNIKRSYTTDGRAGGEKFDSIQIW